MESRGRKSAANLAIVNADGVSAIRRPDPPIELNAEQGHEWRSIVNRLPADWFPRETEAMLSQYCRHVVAAKRVASLISDYELRTEDFVLDDYDRLLKMQEREGRAISSLATRMRISQQSTLNKEKRKPLKPAEKPWHRPSESQD